MENKKKLRKFNIPVFIPHEGCPHDCVFCSQRKITGVQSSVTPKMADEIIAAAVKTLPDVERNVEVAYFGGSFTGIDLDIQEEFLKTADKYREYIDGIRLSTRPDYINREVMELLSKYGASEIELGVQSSDDGVLALNKRGHDFEDVIKAVRLIREYDISYGLQMMIGMYGSTPEKDIKTAEDIISLKPKTSRIYPTVTIADTELEKLYRDGKYEPYSISEAVEVAAEILKKFRAAGVEVIRIGLHAGEDLQADGNIVAGPFHPAFGELVESELMRREIEKKIIEANARDCEFVVSVPSDMVSKAVGHGKRNKKYFYEKYGVRLKTVAEKGT